MRRREVKSQRGQRIHHAKCAHLLTIDGFHTNDAHDDLSGHAGFTFGARQAVPVLLPEFHTRLNAVRINEATAVHTPVLGGANGGRLDVFGNLRQIASLTNGRTYPSGVQLPTERDVIGRQHGIGTLRIGRAWQRRLSCPLAGINFSFLSFLGCSPRG